MGKSKSFCAAFVKGAYKNMLLICLICSLAIGIGLGAGMRSYDLSERDQMYFRFPGDLLMRMLKALIIPLIVSSLVSGLAGLKTSASGRMGLFAIIYYLVTTLVAVLLGILLVVTIKPGEGSSREPTGTAEKGNIVDSFLDLIRNLFPDNLVEAAFRQTKTYQVPVYDKVNITVNSTDCNNETLVCEVLNETEAVVRYDPETRVEYGMNVLGLVVFSVALGIVVSQLGDTGRPIYLFCYGLAEATMKLVTAVIWYSPFGIVFLVAAEIIQMDDPIAELNALGLYIATVMAGLAIHGLILLPTFYFVIVRRNPFIYLYNNLQALLTALGTASSSATLPVTYKCLEQNNGIDPRVTRFVLPVGAVINMDGTALYEAVAAIFIAQTRSMHLDAANVVAISITATLASIGAASVPQAGLVTMVIVLTAIGLPADDVTMILAVDWMLDRFRTMVNVEGDSFGAGIIAHLSRHQLAEEDAALRMEAEETERKKQNGFIEPAYGTKEPLHENGGFVHDEVLCTGL